ncbi:tetratricopeptide repeat protein [Lysobacter sp. S4-A87]|uniref:tetratricopeptide repeat protein n=1 Tax=Lysobacter sp. S4-A87 TaxID=2925843 RepID=UPI001F53200F|nr:tetratricopeptide repeat protein [Lysobacter sp. S4-A87]UNK50638.1 tetratricopeptide repeat protein [Lysobacter sp. S4-A87]
MALLAAGTFSALRALGSNHATVIAVVLLLVPGRIQGLLYRPLFRGQRALATLDPALALSEFRHFLQILERQPWRKWALWLSWSIYTPSAKAMGLNNIGVAYAAMGEVDAAEAAWREALIIDPLYSIPHANLAAAVASRGQADIAADFLAAAAGLGYTGGALDRATCRVQQLLAKVESRGPSV